MAHIGILPGMPSASLLAQPECDVLGKQTKTSVPKVQEEGWRATEKLMIMWIDFAGPMHIKLHTGNQYVMDLVNDY